MSDDFSTAVQRLLEAQAVQSLLDVFVVTGWHEFPAVRDEADERALEHAERLTANGLLRRLESKEGRGPNYEITKAGRAAHRAFREAT